MIGSMRNPPFRKHWVVALAIASVLASSSCGRRSRGDETSGDEEEGTPIVRGSARAELCTEQGDQYLQMPYDTNGDGAPDVIRVYLVTETANQNGSRLGRRVVCREADLNSDGVRDVVRVYDDQQRVSREQQDRDFDGRPDYWEYYENGQLLRIDEDTNRDERIDTRTYMDMQGRPERIERDLAGRSQPGAWRADHYEFFSEGRLVRMGEDLDLDGTIDRWNRDRLFESEVAERERAALGTNEGEGAGVDPDAGVVPDGGVTGRDPSVPDGGIRSDAGTPRSVGVNDAGRPATSGR